MDIVVFYNIHFFIMPENQAVVQKDNVTLISNQAGFFKHFHIFGNGLK